MSATFRFPTPEKWFPFQWLRLKSLNGKPTCDVMVWTPPTQRHRGAIAWSS
jgi:hypothetical protein